MTDNKTPSRSTDRVAREFTPLSFVWRLLFSLVLVLATYNPSGTSYYHWVSGAFSGDGVGALHVFVGLLLLVGWSILWVATWRSLDTFGVALTAAVIAALVWLLIDFGLLSPDSSSAIGWIILISLSLLLSIGLSWSHIWRRLTGQFEVDDED